MMKRLAFLINLLLVSHVYAAPSTTLSIDPSATSGTTITAADENDRNGDVVTWANAHDHTDVSQTANSLNLGDGTAGNKSLCGNAADATDSCLRWDDTNNLWLIQQPSTTFNEVAVISSTTGLTPYTVVLGNGIGALDVVQGVGTSGQVLTSNGSGARPTFQAPSATDTVADRVLLAGGDVTTTSATLVDFTGASITRTTQANPVILGFTGACMHDDVNQAININFDIDGTLVLGTSGKQYGTLVVSENMNCTTVAMSADLTAASHTFKMQWNRAGAGTATMQCDAGDSCNFWMVEVTD